jgi:hypothetical protein
MHLWSAIIKHPQAVGKGFGFDGAGERGEEALLVAYGLPMEVVYDGNGLHSAARPRAILPARRRSD